MSVEVKFITKLNNLLKFIYLFFIELKLIIYELLY